MKLLSSLSRSWCQAMHPSPMWPVNGQYRCPTCMRVYPVAWEVTPHPPEPKRHAPPGYQPAMKSAEPVAVVAK